MRRIIRFCCLALVGAGLVGFTSPTPELDQYKRTPLSVKLQRFQKSGTDLFMRHRYEEALAVFQTMGKLDPGNIDALFWEKKVREKLFHEETEKFKADLWRTKGSLVLKESKYDNWHWGPEVGHFEIRQSIPKPYIPPVKKIRPPIAEAEFAKIKEKATDAAGLFELAIACNSRKEFEKGFDALDEAALRDPEILGRDDEGLVATLLEDLQKPLETGKITPRQRVLLGRISMLSGDLSGAALQLIKGASREAGLVPDAQKAMERLLGTGKTEFLYKSPEIYRFAQAYAYQESEDRMYVSARVNPTTPHYVFPFEFPFEAEAVEAIEIKSPDFLFGSVDLTATDTARIWFTGVDNTDEPRNLDLRAVIRFKPGKLGGVLDLSTWSVPAELGNNWSLVIAPPTAFNPAFPVPQKQTSDGGIEMKAFQVQQSGGKGPYLNLDEFHKPLPKDVDVFKAIDGVWDGG